LPSQAYWSKIISRGPDINRVRDFVSESIVVILPNEFQAQFLFRQFRTGFTYCWI